jgi:hypothetical protein
LRTRFLLAACRSFQCPNMDDPRASCVVAQVSRRFCVHLPQSQLDIHLAVHWTFRGEGFNDACYEGQRLCQVSFNNELQPTLLGRRLVTCIACCCRILPRITQVELTLCSLRSCLDDFSVHPSRGTASVTCLRRRLLERPRCQRPRTSFSCTKTMLSCYRSVCKNWRRSN